MISTDSENGQAGLQRYFCNCPLSYVAIQLAHLDRTATHYDGRMALRPMRWKGRHEVFQALMGNWMTLLDL